MWNPSINYKELLEPTSFEAVGHHYNDFYVRYVQQFRKLWEAVKDIHVNNGMELALTRGQTSSVKGSLILTIRTQPTYKFKPGDVEYDADEQYDFENDFLTDFTMTILDIGDEEYLSTMSFKAINSGEVMLKAIESFPTERASSIKIPSWFIETVQKFTKEG